MAACAGGAARLLPRTAPLGAALELASDSHDDAEVARGLADRHQGQEHP